jgi:hypothetical protein
MLPIHVTLQYYKRADIRKAIAKQCNNKEVAVQYGKGFGKRPDVIIYDSDVLSFATKKATSFHVSEETWSNPMQLTPGMRSSECNDLRTGWDLVIDIDFPVWEATKIICDTLIKQLYKEGVPKEAVTVKFSGNKGFHICVPFEAFPEYYVDESNVEVFTSDLFPEGVRRVVEYLVDRVDGPKNNFALSQKVMQIPDVASNDDLFVTVDAASGEKVSSHVAEGNQFVCPACEQQVTSTEDFMSCPRCGSFMQKVSDQKDAAKTVKKVDLEIDTLLISSRHMYRMVYSLHEKSGLASIPVNPETILSFERESANPDSVTIDRPFLSRDVEAGCAQQLLYNAMKFTPPGWNEPLKDMKEVEWTGDAAPEEIFPPPINQMLGKLRDGRKRALFVLTNFFKSIGWSYEQIEARLNEWNKQLPDPLRENDIISHLRYHKRKKTILPPNFDNDMYYRDILGDALKHDELSASVKNPVTYVRKRMKAHDYQQAQKDKEAKKE